MTNGAISLPTSAARVLRFLAGGPASVMPAARVGKFMLEAAGRGSVAADADLLALLASAGVVVRTSHGAALSASGQALAQQLAEKRRSRDDSDIGLAVVEAGRSVRSSCPTCRNRRLHSLYVARGGMG